MGIRVSYEPNGALQAAYGAGLGEYQKYLDEMALRKQQLAQQQMADVMRLSAMQQAQYNQQFGSGGGGGGNSGMSLSRQMRYAKHGWMPGSEVGDSLTEMGDRMNQKVWDRQDAVDQGEFDQQMAQMKSQQDFAREMADAERQSRRSENDDASWRRTQEQQNTFAHQQEMAKQQFANQQALAGMQLGYTPSQQAQIDKLTDNMGKVATDPTYTPEGRAAAIKALQDSINSIRNARLKADPELSVMEKDGVQYYYNSKDGTYKPVYQAQRESKPSIDPKLLATTISEVKTEYERINQPISELQAKKIALERLNSSVDESVKDPTPNDMYAARNAKRNPGIVSQKQAPAPVPNDAVRPPMPESFPVEDSEAQVASAAGFGRKLTPPPIRLSGTELQMLNNLPEGSIERAAFQRARQMGSTPAQQRMLYKRFLEEMRAKSGNSGATTVDSPMGAI